MALIGDIGARLRVPPRLRQLGEILRGWLLVAAERWRRLGLERLGFAIRDRLPKGLYARSILIVVLPILILQAVVAYVFMERHWQTVTRRLSSAVVGDIAAIIDVIDTYPQDPRFSDITRIAAETYGLTISVLPPAPLPEAGPRPFFSLLELDADARDRPPRQPSVLDRHARQFRHGRDSYRPRRSRASRLCAT